MNHECALEAMMEERDQFRAAVATSKSLNNFNCCTITPTNSPIDAAGVSVTPGDATNSEFEGEVPGASARAQRDPTREDGFSSPSIHFPPSVSSGAFNELARHSLNARNLAGAFPCAVVGHFSFISSPHRLGVVEQHQQSMRQMQNGYPATHKWYPGNDRVH